MALPDNAPIVDCSLSKPLLAEGTEGVITSAFLEIDRDLVWVETGETIYKEPVPVNVIVDYESEEVIGTVRFSVIPVNAPGMRDLAGNDVINWMYSLRVNVGLPGVTRTVTYRFQPLLGETSFDLDLVPHLNVDPLPPVTSVGLIDGGGP